MRQKWPQAVHEGFAPAGGPEPTASNYFEVFMSILVTGGTGGLGRLIVGELLKQSDAMVRVMTRTDPAMVAPPRTEWAVADLISGSGVSEALQGVDIVIHAATDYVVDPAHADVTATSLLLHEAKLAGVSHLCYVSIVGSDRVPLPYYGAKVACEALVKESELSWSIFRATQFHSLVDQVIQEYSKPLLVALLPTELRFQSIDTSEAAAELVRAALTRTPSNITEICGPEVMTLGAMAQIWFAEKSKKPAVVPVHIPSQFKSGPNEGLSADPAMWELADAYRRGLNTCTGSHKTGVTTWKEWVKQHP